MLIIIVNKIINVIFIIIINIILIFFKIFFLLLTSIFLIKEFKILFGSLSKNIDLS